MDEFAGVWREWVEEGDGPFNLESETPFIHVGDFNLVGYRQQVITLRDGDIDNESQYGEDFLPDWDNTAIVDLFSRHTHKRMGYTWRSDGSSFNPGKLDYVFYSDATIDSSRHFTLNTLAMDEETLSENGLEWDDTQEASDHLPRIFDVTAVHGLDVEHQGSLPQKFYLGQNFPNPFNPSTTISFTVEAICNASLQIFDMNGRWRETLVDNDFSPGNHEIVWNALNQPSGVYFMSLASKDFVETRKIILLK